MACGVCCKMWCGVKAMGWWQVVCACAVHNAGGRRVSGAVAEVTSRHGATFLLSRIRSLSTTARITNGCLNAKMSVGDICVNRNAINGCYGIAPPAGRRVTLRRGVRQQSPSS